MSSTKIANDIKRRITAHATDLSRQPVPLALAEHDGIMWATNRYWITPASRVAPLLEQYNLNADTPGAFEVNTTVRKHDDSAPDISRLIGDLASYPDPIAPVKLGGRTAYVETGDRSSFMLAVYQTADGTLLGLPDADLAWLSETYICGHKALAVTFGLGPNDRFGEVRVVSKGHGAAPVMLVADVIRTLAKASYGDDGKGEYQPAETQNLGPRVIGMLMAVKLDG